MNKKIDKEFILHEIKALAHIHKFIKDHDTKTGKREDDITISNLKDSIITRAFALLDTIIEKGELNEKPDN